MYPENKQLKKRIVIEITKETRQNLSKFKNIEMGSYDKVIDYLIKIEKASQLKNGKQI